MNILKLSRFSSAPGFCFDILIPAGDVWALRDRSYITSSFWGLGEGDPPPCDIEIICAYHLESGKVSMQYMKYMHKLQEILIICNI